MSDLGRKWIAIAFNNDEEHIVPVIRMNGAGGLKKTIKDVGGVKEINIFCLDFNTQSTSKLGTVSWPDGHNRADLIITYQPDKRYGEIQISGIDMIWSYDLKKKEGSDTFQQDAHFKNNKKQDELTQKDNSMFQDKSTEKMCSHEIVNRDKVRELEEKENIRIVWPDELADELKKEIYGQDEAIKKLSELIAANLRRKNPEVEVIILFGPTGVGKTEVGKNLSHALTKLTGIKYGLQQVAMNEFVGEHSINRFFGAPPSYVGYKDPTIFEHVRQNPYQIYLLDEIEKATERIWTGLMEAFSTGIVHMADNSPDINLSHVIFIITSNIEIDMKSYNEASTFKKKEICRDTLSKACGHPEIAGKITNCLAFQPLSKDSLTDIVSKFVVEELDNYDMELDRMDENLMVQLKQQHSNYGARGVRDAVREAMISTTVYDRNIKRYKGKKVYLKGNIDNIQIEVVS